MYQLVLLSVLLVNTLKKYLHIVLKNIDTYFNCTENIFEIANGQSPKNLNDHFTFTNVKHQIGTRSSSIN